MKNTQTTHGMTLLEVMFSTAIFTVVVGSLFSFSLVFGNMSDIQEVKARGLDEAKRAMGSVVPDLRQAVFSSINQAQLLANPEEITYATPEDLDGNGTPVDINNNIEMGAPKTIRRDTEDIDGDGNTDSQLIVVQAGKFPELLANNLCPVSEQRDANGAFGPTEDTNGNGRLDQGILFELVGTAIRVTIQCEDTTRNLGRGESAQHTLPTKLQTLVVPRN